MMMFGFASVLMCVGTGMAGASMVVVERQTQVLSGSATSTVITGSLPTPSQAQNINGSKYDLSQHFCRLYRHASVYANGKIYVDGGNTYTPNANTSFSNTPLSGYDKGTNDNLLIIDLSQNFSNQDTFPYSVVHKDPQVPNGLIEQALWYSSITRKIYQIGGWFSFNGQNTDPAFVPTAQIPEAAVWEFDVDTQLWAQSDFNYVNTGDRVNRPGAAANCDAPGLNRSFLFEGYMQQRSQKETRNFTQSSEFQFLEGMLQLDTNTAPPTLTNISVPNYIGPRMNGAMVHVPVGKQGVLVQIAGQIPNNATAFGVPIQGASGNNINIDNGFVDIYDIETGYWFRQQTFGTPDIPPSRSDVCTVLVSAADGSSHNIFVIAGIQDYAKVVAHEDMWVLSLPSFQWVQVHTRPGGVYGHTCHAVGENLIIVGGMQTDEKGGDLKNCSSHMPAEIFSLVDMEYTGKFDFEGASRKPPVPADVIKIVGGNALGGAQKSQPLIWNDTYLQYIFNPALTRIPYTPTYTLANSSLPINTTTPSPSPSPAAKKSHTGAIAGGAIGGVLFLALIIALIVIFLRRRRARRQGALNTHTDPNMPPPGELPSYQDTKDMNPNAVEVSAYQEPLTFTPYQMQTRQPQEMDAEEERDQWRPLSESSVGGLGVKGTPQQGPHGSPRVSEVSRESVGSAVGLGIGESVAGSPKIGSEGVVSPQVGSEVGGSSVMGSPRVGGARSPEPKVIRKPVSRQSEVED